MSDEKTSETTADHNDHENQKMKLFYNIFRSTAIDHIMIPFALDEERQFVDDSGEKDQKNAMADAALGDLFT